MYIVQLGVAIASLFNGKLKKMWRGERDSFHVLREKVDPNARYIWVHAASLGEFEQGRPYVGTNELSFTIPMSRFKRMTETMKECFLFDSHAWKKVKARLEE